MNAVTDAVDPGGGTGQRRPYESRDEALGSLSAIGAIQMSPKPPPALGGREEQSDHADSDEPRLETGRARTSGARQALSAFMESAATNIVNGLAAVSSLVNPQYGGRARRR